VNEYALGIDLGGSSIKAAAVAPDGRILVRRVVEFDSNGAHCQDGALGERALPRSNSDETDWARKIRELSHQLEQELGPITSIGLSAPGLAARDERSIAYMPGRLRGLEGLDWAGFLERHQPVKVLNDAHAALLGECWLGAAAGQQNAFMLTLGTGVGGAAMVDGKLLRGHLGRAGHLGHICLALDGASDITGTPGSLELMIGNCSIAERSRGRFSSTHELIAAHLKGDPEASAVWLRSVKALAGAVASLINVLDPEAVIIGGGIARAGDALFSPLTEFLDPIEWRPGGHRVKLLPATLGEFAGAIGAAAYSRAPSPSKVTL
jgi:glucokinase